MTATHSHNITKRFRPGDTLLWSVYEAGPPNMRPAAYVPVVVVDAGIELRVVLHPGEDYDAWLETFGHLEVDLAELKIGPFVVFDCVQHEDCMLLQRYVTPRAASRV